MGARRKPVPLLMTMVLAGGLFGRLEAQMTPDDLAARPGWEAFLKEAKIVRAESVGEGVTRPKKLTLRMGDVESYAVWKNPTGPGGGLFDKWECEIAAYRLDKLLGLNMVPPTVKRTYKGREGSLQLWMATGQSELRRIEDNIAYPPEKVEHIEKMLSLQRAFDSLIANNDRTLQNLRWTEDWRLVLIDHSQCFRFGTTNTRQLIYGKYGMRKEQRFLRLPRPFVERIRSLTFEQIRQAVDFYLTYEEIEGILKRRKLLLKEIEELISEKGEAAVLY